MLHPLLCHGPAVTRGQRRGQTSGVRLVSPVVEDPLGPTRGFAVNATPTPPGPHAPCRLVRHRRAVPPATREQPPSPWAATVRSPLHPAQRGACPVPEPWTHVASAPRAEPSPSRLPTRGVLRGPQPSPGGTRAAMLDPPDRASRRDPRRRHHRAPPWDRHQPRTLRMGLGQAGARLWGRGDRLLSGHTRLNQLPTPLLAQRRARVRRGRARLPHGVRARRPPLGITLPSSCIRPCPAVITAIRSPLRRSRTRCRAGSACGSMAVAGTHHRGGRAPAAAMASAARLSCWCALTHGLTHWGAMRLTAWPCARHRLAQSGAPPQAALPMRPGGHCALQGIRAWRVRRVRQSMFPVVSAPPR
jgi:hypothetical protein